jgi:hypothetical protein
MELMDAICETDPLCEPFLQAAGECEAETLKSLCSSAQRCRALLGRDAPFFQPRANYEKRGGIAPIFLLLLRHHSIVNEVLEFLVSTEAEHLVTATRGIARVKVCVNQIVERLELERNLLRQDRTKLFRHDIRGAPRETRMVSHGQAAFFSVRPLGNATTGMKELSGNTPGDDS